MTTRRLTLLVLLVAVFFLLPSGVQFYADWLWFGEVGYQRVYELSLATQSTLWLTTFVIAFGALTLNLRLAFRVLTRREIVMMTPEGPRAIVVDPARLRPIVTLASAAGAVLVASIAAAQWEKWLIYWSAAPFGKADPVLGYDVGFYVFQLPFWRWLHSLAILLLALTTVGVGLVDPGAGFLRLSAQRGIHLLAARIDARGRPGGVLADDHRDRGVAGHPRDADRAVRADHRCHRRRRPRHTCRPPGCLWWWRRSRLLAGWTSR